MPFPPARKCPAAGRKTDLRQRRRRWIRFDTTQGIIPAQFGQVPQRIPDNKISPCCAGFSGPGRAKPSLRRQKMTEKHLVISDKKICLNLCKKQILSPANGGERTASAGMEDGPCHGTVSQIPSDTPSVALLNHAGRGSIFPGLFLSDRNPGEKHPRSVCHKKVNIFNIKNNVNKKLSKGCFAQTVRK